MKWNFLMYIKVLNKHVCFTAEKPNFYFVINPSSCILGWKSFKFICLRSCCLLVSHIISTQKLMSELCSSRNWQIYTDRFFFCCFFFSLTDISYVSVSCFQSRGFSFFFFPKCFGCETTACAVNTLLNCWSFDIEGQTRTLQASQHMDQTEVERTSVPRPLAAPPVPPVHSVHPSWKQTAREVKQRRGLTTCLASTWGVR